MCDVAAVVGVSNAAGEKGGLSASVRKVGGCGGASFSDAELDDPSVSTGNVGEAPPSTRGDSIFSKSKEDDDWSCSPASNRLYQNLLLRYTDRVHCI